MKAIAFLILIALSVPCYAQGGSIKESLVDQLKEKVQAKIDEIIAKKERAEAAKAKIDAVKAAIDARIEELKQDIKEFLVEKKKQQIKERAAEIQETVDAIKEVIARLQGIKEKIAEVKAWVDAAPELPQGWGMVIFRPTDDGPKAVVVRPEAVTLPAGLESAAYSVPEANSFVCSDRDCGDSACDSGCSSCKCSPRVAASRSVFRRRR